LYGGKKINWYWTGKKSDLGTWGLEKSTGGLSGGKLEQKKTIQGVKSDKKTVQGVKLGQKAVK